MACILSFGERIQLKILHDIIKHVKWKHFLCLTGQWKRSLDGFFDVRLNKRLSKQPWRQ